MDLLDDWTKHYAFESIKTQVLRSYEIIFDRADFVFANSEGTLELAHRYGRPDARLVLNGCDPDKFSTRSEASGPTTVGYVGKIGKRVDLELVRAATAALEDWNFVFAGPILDRNYKRALGAIPNLQMLGDVHYTEVPALLQKFDIGWVPHATGTHEVGGDVIKTYEYRAAGLPVVSTPVIGSDRAILGVDIREPGDHSSALRHLVSPDSLRVARVPIELPLEMRWETKARLIARLLDVELTDEPGGTGD